MIKENKQTTVAKAVDAAGGQQTKSEDRGLYDSAAKRLVSTRYILAWIVKASVREASALTIKQIATRCISPEITVSARPVCREDAEAEDPGRVRMEQTEDALATEGTVRYDILFTLRLPGEPEPILIIVNVELQNLAWLGYPLIARGIFYAARLLGQQGPNYDSLHKVYSIWIVSNPPKAEENSIVSYSIIKKVLIREAACVSAKAQERQEQDDGALPGIPEAEELSDAKPAKTEHVNTETSAEPQVILHESAGGAVWRLEPLEEKADLMEVIFLNLGELDAERDPEHPTVLGLLDVLFSGSLGADEIKKILKTTFDIPVTKEMKEDMETMGDNRFAFEVKAEERGFRRGEIKGRNKLLFAQVRDKILSVAEAAKYTEVPEAVFEAEMLEYEAVQTSAG